MSIAEIWNHCLVFNEDNCIENSLTGQPSTTPSTSQSNTTIMGPVESDKVDDQILVAMVILLVVSCCACLFFYRNSRETEHKEEKFAHLEFGKFPSKEKRVIDPDESLVTVKSLDEDYRSFDSNTFSKRTPELEKEWLRTLKGTLSDSGTDMNMTKRFI